MKYLMLFLIVAFGTLSCHRRSALAEGDCCAKHSAAGAETTTTAGVEAPAVAGIGNGSVYLLPGSWTDQHDHPVVLSDLKGKVQVVAMIFTHCGYACPRIVQDMKAIQQRLPASERKHVGFLLVSFDSERDDPAQLARYAAQQGLDDQWTLLHGDARQVRELSMLLNVRYQQAGDGGYVHSNSILILDAGGVVRRSLDGLDTPGVPAIDAIGALAGR
jgi:protein SCO1/2